MPNEAHQAEPAPTAADAMEAAEIGSWQWLIVSNAVQLSAQSGKLLGCAADQPASYDGFIGLVHPSDRAQVDTTLRASFAPARPMTSIFEPAAITGYGAGAGAFVSKIRLP